MRCTKCGREASDGAKFCPNCGEKFSEAAYCSKCGAKVDKEMIFCPECGNQLGGAKKGKRSVGFKKKMCIMAGAAAAVVLVLVCIMLNTDKSALKAYAKFQTEYHEQYGQYQEVNDCCAGIIMSPKGEKWLAILDAMDVAEDSATYRINVYRYGWGRVKKVAGISNIRVDDYIGFSVIDEKLYLFVDDRDYGLGSSNNGKIGGVYYLNENDKFVQEKVTAKADTEKNTYVEMTESGKTIDELLLLGNIKNSSAVAVNCLMSVLAEDFPMITDELARYKIKDQADLQIAYGKILKENGIWNVMDEFLDRPLNTDYPVVGVVESEYGYYLLRTSGNLGLVRAKNINELDKALKEADGRKVSRIEREALAGRHIKEVTIPNNIDYIGTRAFVDCEKLQTVTISDGVKRIGKEAFKGCGKLQQIRFPDSIEVIGDDILDDTGVPGPVILTEEGTTAGRYAEENGFDCQEKELDKAQIEERKTIGEAAEYFEEQVENTELHEADGSVVDPKVALIYLDDDNIPECVIYGEGYSLSGYLSYYRLLSYTKGVEDEVYGDLRYIPRSGKYMAERWVNGHGYEYIVKSLGDTIVEESVITNFMAAVPDEAEHAVDGRDLGSAEAVEDYISSLGFTDQIEGDKLFSSVSEAYHNLKN